ncbi:DEAD/DEAH box helicase [Marinihelvus fidelis]|uniref:ATP-dependent RNA helicase RhlB n=1 Tax=Marinihelvus fidelis TaxID=2613842 RepID=A0A5N0T9V9_9GAMM|nr:DEAD/DEAH box helicase [Marinihelvus fidelis]KAA9131833.1 DEAD/DEAH box helicase [Marinihelvus fidelis]
MSKQDHGSPLSDVAFASLELEPSVMAGVKDAGFTHCTPIQALTLPPALEGRDVAGQAQTGTGKTAAFLLVAFNRLAKTRGQGEQARHPGAVIIAPTRELALQIHKDAETLGGHTGLKLALAYGGVDYDKQRKALEEGCDILIGTPGRMIDYFKQKVYALDQVEVAILDEADRMFDLGFIKDIRYMLRRMPEVTQRQSLMFSATLAQRVMELAYEHMNDPVTLKVEADNVTADNVKQSVFYPANEEKLPLLIQLLRDADNGRTMVFTNTRQGADDIGRTLNANGLPAAVISGRVHQKKRQSLLRRFHDGDIRILVATDVAARGLHIPDVTHVFNFDLPQDPEDYVHRVGRTARLGAKGEAISFACEDFAFGLPDIESYIGYAIPMESVDPGNLPEIEKPPRPPRKRSGPGGQRRHGGGGRRGGGRSSDAPASQSASGAEGDKPKRRRRRRRKPATTEGA